MKIPNIGCKVSAHCDVHPSEDPEKIRQAISNVFPDSEIRVGKSTALATADLDSLWRIYETMHSRQSQRAYLRHLKNNTDGGSTWFFLNKQAAFANNVALCDHADESPLGPIRIVLESDRIERVIEWLTGSAINKN